MEIILKIASVVLAYLLGSIPTAVWVGKIFYGIDIRNEGSGNAGATNTFRVLGIKAGIPVLLFDSFKGWAAVKIAGFTGFWAYGTDQFISYQIVLGAAAVIGHIYPLYARFKGGKGVATLLGLVLAILPYPALFAIVIFCIMLLLFRYVSLSSMTAGLCFPIIVIFFFKTQIVSLVIFSIAIAFLLLFTHRKNILRLIAGTELKANIFGKKKVN